MQRTLLGLALLVGLTTLVACGGDTEDPPASTTGGTVATGGTTSTGGTTAAVVMCGGETCEAPAFGSACCDEASSKCGIDLTGMGTCSVPADPHPTCPGVDAAQDLPLTSCCVDATNLCGVSVPLLGCQDLASAKAFAEGIAAGSGDELPDPIHCDGTPVEDTTGADAGM